MPEGIAAAAPCPGGPELGALAFAQARVPLAVVDASGRVLQANAAMAALCGAPAQGCAGLRLTDALGLPAPWPPAGPVDWDWSAADQRRRRPLQLECLPLDGAPEGCRLVQVRDMTDRRRAERALQQLAWSDTFTGLPNRTATGAHVAARASARPLQPFALLLIQLEGLNSLIQWLGQSAADEAVTTLAQRLREALPGGFAGRWDNRRFVALLDTDADGALLRAQATQLLQALAQPLPGRIGALRLSAGAVRCPADGQDADELVERASAALQSLAASSGLALALYEPAMQQVLKRAAGLEAALRADLDAGRLHAVVQPKADRHGRHTGAELLLRWTSAAYGEVRPDEFIALAERTGLIGRVGQFALRSALEVVRALRALLGDQAPRVAVNLSPYELLQPDLPQQLQACCQQAGVAPSAIELELTESALSVGADLVAALLHDLRRRGFVLALDDFGSEYSSLRHLRELPFQNVKIDRAFLKRLETDAPTQALLRGMVSLCAGLGLHTVVEGVETEAQFHRLVELGVQEFQGYWVAQPLPPSAWLAQLREGRAKVAQGPA